jgi:hypothetical protein
MRGGGWPRPRGRARNSSADRGATVHSSGAGASGPAGGVLAWAPAPGAPMTARETNAPKRPSRPRRGCPSRTARTADPRRPPPVSILASRRAVRRIVTGPHAPDQRTPADGSAATVPARSWGQGTGRYGRPPSRTDDCRSAPRSLESSSGWAPRRGARWLRWPVLDHTPARTLRDDRSSGRHRRGAAKGA